MNFYFKSIFKLDLEKYLLYENLNLIFNFKKINRIKYKNGY